MCDIYIYIYTVPSAKILHRNNLFFRNSIRKVADVQLLSSRFYCRNAQLPRLSRFQRKAQCLKVAETNVAKLSRRQLNTRQAHGTLKGDAVAGSFSPNEIDRCDREGDKADGKGGREGGLRTAEKTAAVQNRRGRYYYSSSSCATFSRTSLSLPPSSSSSSSSPVTASGFPRQSSVLIFRVATPAKSPVSQRSLCRASLSVAKTINFLPSKDGAIFLPVRRA